MKELGMVANDLLNINDIGCAEGGGRMWRFRHGGSSHVSSLLCYQRWGSHMKVDSMTEQMAKVASSSNK
eukprot:CAMPEP_0183742570 /NCGR_PEP_ID=MMETSP0737-20130205/64767_1 /TAXON_ID=385413 /ORGANISM="Thalassiosira miniscula, Strain CCMP1093" /LENGTH=68 /DNA_ID=CAMNT_0025978157 /DNA_START=441 /DNA_END=647 /DNA_ORIENTATION=+